MDKRITPSKQCIALLAAFALSVQEHELGCLRFHLHRKFAVTLHGNRNATESPPGAQLINLETYVNKAALDHHVHTKAFKQLVQTLTEEEILREPLVVVGAEPILGFGGRLLGLQAVNIVPPIVRPRRAGLRAEVKGPRHGIRKSTRG